MDDRTNENPQSHAAHSSPAAEAASDAGAAAPQWDEHAFQHLVEYAPAAMVVVDAAGHIVLANAQAERLFGYARAEMVGLGVEQLLPERFAAAHPAHRRAFLADAQPRTMGANRDLFARRRDGSEFAVEIGLTPVAFTGGPMVVAAIVDITERYRMEERFRRVVEYAPSAMVMIGPSGRIVLVNAQTELLFAYPREDLIGQPIEILVPERLRADHVHNRLGYFGQPRPRPMGRGRELFGCRRDGSEFPVEIGLNPIDSEEGVMVLASIVDITERRRTQLVLEKALREKTALLNEVHHRVKNNLQVISSLLNLQASHTDDQRLREILQVSQGRVKAMALTHQLLYEGRDFSRLDLANFLARLVQLLRGSYQTEGGTVSLQVELPDTPVYLDLERAVPCALLVNELSSNAFKHAFPDERGGTIRITLEPLEAGEVQLSVCDDGVGLPADFDLNQVKSLGLQLVPLFVDQLQARLSIDSASGTRFSLRFSTQPEPRETS